MSDHEWNRHSFVLHDVKRAEGSACALNPLVPIDTVMCGSLLNLYSVDGSCCRVPVASW